MKKILFAGILLLFIVSFGNCGHGKKYNDECRIHGEMGDHSRDGKKIYLVPMIRPDSVGVDSTEIKDGKFEFTTRKRMMGIVRVELCSRYGLQDLLVVTEPGDIVIKIDSISNAGGTPQNDLLQQWKEYTQMHTQRLRPYLTKSRSAGDAGDTTMVKTVKAQLDSLQREYRQYSRALAERIEEGPLRDFLKTRFPTSYKKKMSDGSIEEIKID